MSKYLKTLQIGEDNYDVLTPFSAKKVIKDTVTTTLSPPIEEEATVTATFKNLINVSSDNNMGCGFTSSPVVTPAQTVYPVELTTTSEDKPRGNNNLSLYYTTSGLDVTSCYNYDFASNNAYGALLTMSSIKPIIEYVKTEIDTKISETVSNISVNNKVVDTYSALESIENPQEGQLVSTKDTNKIYRYDDSTETWIDTTEEATSTKQWAFIENFLRVESVEFQEQYTQFESHTTPNMSATISKLTDMSNGLYGLFFLKASSSLSNIVLSSIFPICGLMNTQPVKVKIDPDSAVWEDAFIIFNVTDGSFDISTYDTTTGSYTSIKSTIEANYEAKNYGPITITGLFLGDYVK